MIGFSLILGFFIFSGVYSFPKPSENYQKYALLKGPDIYRVLWKTDENRITFEIQVKAKGWCSLGLSPDGGMTKSDIFTAWIQDGKVIYHVSMKFFSGCS